MSRRTGRADSLRGVITYWEGIQDAVAELASVARLAFTLASVPPSVVAVLWEMTEFQKIME